MSLPEVYGTLSIESTFIDPAIYPWFEIYPGHVSTGENGVTSRVTLQSAYPQFDICRPLLCLVLLSSHIFHTSKIPQYTRTLISIVRVLPRKMNRPPC